MHIYERLWSDDPLENPPSVDTFRFRSPHDVAAYAQHWCCVGRVTWPDVWHLDRSGAVVTYLKGTTLESVRTWAADASRLLRDRAQNPGPREHWVIVESRQEWKYGATIVDERDAKAFLELRSRLHDVDVALLDVVVFDDRFHWWSLHELTSGRTHWTWPDDEAAA